MALTLVWTRQQQAATTIVVNSLSDVANPNDGLCTLREAITAANTNLASGGVAGECAAGSSSGADKITFTVTGTISLTGVLPDIASDMTITGPGSGQLTVQRSTSDLYRIFNITSGVVTLSGLTVTNGKTPDGGTTSRGGGIQNGGTLTMNDVVVASNQTGTGGTLNFNNGPGGGGIDNQGTLTITNCSVIGNNTANATAGTTPMWGGGVANTGTLTIANSVVSGNSTGNGNPNEGFGGGIYNDGQMTVTGTSITNNTTGNGGNGAGLYNASGRLVTINNTTFSNNSSPNSGGAIMNNGAVQMANSTISGNTANVGSGIYNVSISDVRNTTVSGNHTGNAIEDASTVNLINCTVTLNDSYGFNHTSPNNDLVMNTIIAGNAGVSDVHGHFFSDGGNLIGRADGSDGFGIPPGDQVGSIASPLDPHLGPLADNGGPTKTHALLSNSTALDAGKNCVDPDVGGPCDLLTPLLTDQRGTIFNRKVDGPDGDTTATVDIGAYEMQTALASLPDTSINEDTQLAFTFDGGDTITISSVTATSSNSTLVPNDPAHLSVTMTGSTGVVTINPAANENGTTNITVTINRTGGPESKTFLLTVIAVNDAPSFTKGVDQTVFEDAGPQTVNNWATGISAGPADESGQVLTFQVTGNTNASLFSAGPAISSTGTLTYTPAANANGDATITINLKDDGGTANGGVDTSASQSFTITVNAVNDAPSFTKGADQMVNEDAGPQSVPGWATAISAGPPDESGQTLTFQVTGNTNTALFSAGPVVSSTGTLSYTPAANANGLATITINLKDNGGTANGGVDTSASQTFTITVNPVNDAPSFTKGANQTVNEDAGPQTVSNWATSISPGGGADEAGQTLVFQVTGNTNAALFSAGPAIDPSGTLTYTPAANANGSATITINLKDNGGTANGGVDTSASQTFTITVNPVNDAPSFTEGPDKTVNEDSGPQVFNPWATGISAGPADESGQTLTFQVTNNTNAALFSSGPNVSSNGQLSFTPATNANGSASITIVLKDNGGTANGGVDTSAPQTFNITVNAVNDAPSFTKGANQTVNNNAGAVTVPNWATNISPGPANESSQAVTFQVTGNTNAALFTAGPAIGPTGTLTYTPSATAGGTATITINLKDDGGTANGGVDTSASQTFTITVINPTGGYINFASSTASTTESSGSTTVNVVRTGDTSQAVTISYATNPDTGTPCSTANGVASPKCDFTAALGTLSFAAGETSKSITILISQDSYVEGPEVITLTLSSPTGGAALGVPATMSVTIADDITEPLTNVIDDSSTFVRMHYHDFLNREADQSGLDFWTGQMSNCGSSDLTVCRVNVSAAFFVSIEFQQTGYLVERMYRTAYGDATATSTLGGPHAVFVPVVRANEFLADTQRVGRGVVVGQSGWEQALENNRQAYALEFVQTSRFINGLPTTMTPTQFVDKLNTNAGGVLSSSERQTAINLFGIAADTTNVSARAQVLRQIAEDQDLYNAEFNRAFVLSQYIGYLRRNPDDLPDSDYTGFEFWLLKLNQFNGDYIAAEMVKAFISSAEYRQRFGP
jgi:CSLREA domain-containing protein